jgi:hypothetical protein
LLVIGVVLLTASAVLAEDVGTVASVRGAATVVRGGAPTPATVGMAVQLGDELQTGSDGQLRVVFRDDSVIDLSESSALVVDEQVYDPAASSYSSLMRLVAGKARALVGKYYQTPGAVYEVETPTAVAGVRGTSFLVSYDPDSDATRVVGIRGQIQVRSLAERVGEVVYITAQETTTVLRDQAPTPPEPLDERYFRHEIEGLEALSIGNIGSIGVGSPLTAAASVPAPDQAPSSSGLATQLGRDNLRNAGDVAGQPLPIAGATRGSLGVPF